ncbi:hypothetical protein [Inquilinus limosus]
MTNLVDDAATSMLPSAAAPWTPRALPLSEAQIAEIKALAE